MAPKTNNYGGEDLSSFDDSSLLPYPTPNSNIQASWTTFGNSMTTTATTTTVKDSFNTIELKQCFSSPDFLDYEVAAPWDQSIHQSHTLPHFDSSEDIDDDDDDDGADEAKAPAARFQHSAARVTSKNPFDDDNDNNYFMEENTFHAGRTKNASAVSSSAPQWKNDYKPNKEHDAFLAYYQQHDKNSENANQLPVKKAPEPVEEPETQPVVAPVRKVGMRAVFGNPKPKKKASAQKKKKETTSPSVVIASTNKSNYEQTTAPTGPVFIRPDSVTKSSAKDPLKMLFSNPKPIQKRPTTASNQLFV